MATPHAGVDEPGTRCVGKNQPGTVALADAVQARWGGRSLGIYACRNVGGTSSPSTHREGRAYDHAWTKKDSGFEIADNLVYLHADLGIQRIIWWRWIWTSGVGWYEYGGQSPHTDHLHIEQNWSGARYLTTEAARRIIGPGPVTPAPAPAPEVDDMPLKVVSCRDHPGPVYLTDCVTSVRVLTPQALEHGRNLGYYPKATDAVPHDWLSWIDQAQDGHHNPAGV